MPLGHLIIDIENQIHLSNTELKGKVNLIKNDLESENKRTKKDSHYLVLYSLNN